MEERIIKEIEECKMSMKEYNNFIQTDICDGVVIDVDMIPNDKCERSVYHQVLTSIAKSMVSKSVRILCLLDLGEMIC